MVSKLSIVFVMFAVAVAAAQEAARIPAGVNPYLCPNYPYCDNALLHTGTPTQWNWAPWAGAPTSHYEINGIGGDRYPDGVRPGDCPNYPYCNTLAPIQAAPIHAAPIHAAPIAPLRVWPAGVHPAECPNYPYCH